VLIVGLGSGRLPLPLLLLLLLLQEDVVEARDAVLCLVFLPSVL
jgi:hypothetical protein